MGGHMTWSEAIEDLKETRDEMRRIADETHDERYVLGWKYCETTLIDWEQHR
jgi:hypothetical protein